MNTRLLDSRSADADFRLFGGGKAAQLGVLTRAGTPVPEWFCVPSPVFEEYLDHHGLRAKVSGLVPSRETEELVLKWFSDHPLLASFERELEERLRALGWLDEDLAVRSSGLDEDSKDHSFAGLFSTFLFQRGVSRVSLSIRMAWASAFSERGLRYRLERGISTALPRMGVVIQKMIDSDRSGVLFTRDPSAPLDRDSLVIEAVYGQGEGLVGGALEGDHFRIHRDGGQVLLHRRAEHTHEFRRDTGGGLVRVDITAGRLRSQVLSPEELEELRQRSLELEQLAGGAPQDIEWALAGGRLYFLQMRPVTSLPPESFFDPSVNGKAVTLWDNSNIIESYSGVTSPFTFSYASHAYHQVYLQFARMMKVPEKILMENDQRLQNMLGLIRGRIYYNLINWYRLLMIMPGSGNNPAFMETMMGVKKSLSSEHQRIFDFVKDRPDYGIVLKIQLLAVSILRFWRSPTIIREFKSHFNRLYEAGRKEDFRSWDLPRQIDYFLYLRREILPRWQAPIVNDFLCMVFFGVLKSLTSKWVESGDAGASLQNDLLCGQGDLESTEPTKWLMRIAREIDEGDPSFRERFISGPAEGVWKSLPSVSPGIHSRFMQFLDRYGFRCVNELKFEERDLHDDPAFVVGNVASYVRMKSYSIEAMEVRERQIREGAELKVMEKLGGPRRWIYFWVLRHARNAVRNREDLRFDRTKSYGLVRHLMRAVGANFVKLGLLDDEFDVFFLTVEEIIAFVEGRLPTHSLRDLVRIRRPAFEEYKRTPSPPDRFVTYGAVGLSEAYPAVLDGGDLLRELESKSQDPNFLYGTPCCPGVVEGVVRVAHELKDTENLQGEILVTSRTDPGWVPLYPSCSGLLIERGSLLSHSAVVARELGLPTIVGISGGLMKRLKTGQRVRIDAGKGEVRIL